MNEKSRRGGPENRPGGSSANRQASEWLVLLESGDATDEDRERFEEWLAEDPGHREAYVALTDTWGRLTAMRGRVMAAADIEPDPDVVLAELGASRRPRRRSRGLAWAAAAAVLVAAVLGGVLFLPGDSAIPYRTDVGERRTVSLADGSTIELNTDTELLVEFTDERRRIAMSRGEAFFDAAEDTDRPFIVTAGNGMVRAVGTRFTVRLKSPDLVFVMVAEGLVEVTHSSVADSDKGQLGAVAEPPVLRRGQRAEYDREDTRIQDLTPEEIERSQAWRHGLLVFEDASLAEVIAEVNRYTETQLVLAEPAIGDLRLGGTFKTGRTEALLSVLEKSFGIRVSREHRNTIKLHSPTASPAQ